MRVWYAHSWVLDKRLIQHAREYPELKSNNCHRSPARIEEIHIKIIEIPFVYLQQSDRKGLRSDR